METEGSSPHSQVPATCPYPEPAQSSPHETNDSTYSNSQEAENLVIFCV